MRRIGRVCLAALLAAAVSVPAASAKELKPKFGNIDGVYYSDVSGNREACRQAIRNKIALCRQNTSFESNTKNRQYAGCLRIFRRQAESCATHFRHQMSKCDLSGAARITDFTGFSCEVTRTVVEDGGGPGISPMDRRMRARTGSNLRAGPGTNHRVVGSLRTGQEVQVTGRAGDWLRIAAPGGGTAFVHDSLLVAMAGQGQEQAGRKGPESDSVNPALAAASSRCMSARARLVAARKMALERQQPCASSEAALRECRRIGRVNDAAVNEVGRVCCGAFRSSSPHEEKLVLKMKHMCAFYNGIQEFKRCKQRGEPTRACYRYRLKL